MTLVGTKLAARPRTSQVVTKDIILVGNCSSDTNPDAWFPELPKGNPSNAWRKAIKAETNRALALCNSCPVKDECLKVGMELDNLPNGIWGGKLPDERIAASGVDVPKYSYQYWAILRSKSLRRYIS